MSFKKKCLCNYLNASQASSVRSRRVFFWRWYRNRACLAICRERLGELFRSHLTSRRNAQQSWRFGELIMRFKKIYRRWPRNTLLKLIWPSNRVIPESRAICFDWYYQFVSYYIFHSALSLRAYGNPAVVSCLFPFCLKTVTRLLRLFLQKSAFCETIIQTGLCSTPAQLRCKTQI